MPRGHPINYKDPKYIGMYFGTDVYEGFIEKDKHRTPIVQIRCTLCNTPRKVDGSALFRGDKNHLSECPCKGEQKYREYIGELFESDMLIDVGGRIEGQIGAKVKCIYCGTERDIAASALLREVGKSRKKTYKKCECLTHRFDYAYRIGDLSGTDILETFLGEKDSRGYYLVNAKCTLCGRSRKVIGSALIKQDKKALKLCACQENDYRKEELPVKYSSLKGKIIDRDIVLDVYRDDTKEVFVKLKCLDCQEERDILAQRYLNPNYPHLKCGCKKELGYYKSFIGKTIGDDLILNMDKPIGYCFTYKVKCVNCNRERVVKAAKLLTNSEHLNKCDCKKRSYIYHKDDFIGRKFGFLEVKDLINKNRQTYAICNCKCGNITEKPLSQLLAGDGCSCGCVTTSYGEASIAKILLDNNILFSREHKFKDLKSPKNAYLRYDFALWDKDKLVCLIEFDGLQHVDVNYQFGVKTIEEAYAKLKLIQFYDKLKNEYAEKHNIPLFRISYTRSYQEIEDKIINILKVMTLLY